MSVLPKKDYVPLTCDAMRGMIGLFLKRGDNEAHRLWDIMTALRGPDAPSEKPDEPEQVQAAHYAARRKRKAKTTEVIRFKAFYGAVGGSARWRDDRDYVKVPPSSKQDHFDRHIVKAATALGLEMREDD